MDKDEKSLESRANAKSGIYILLIAYFYSIILFAGNFYVRIFWVKTTHYFPYGGYIFTFFMASVGG